MQALGILQQKGAHGWIPGGSVRTVKISSLNESRPQNGSSPSRAFCAFSFFNAIEAR
jgi:hypothetical protein